MERKLNDQFFVDIGQPNLSAEDRASFVSGFIDALNARINYIMLEKMNEEQLAKLNALIEAGDEDKIDEYRKSIFPDIEAITQQEFDKLKQTVISSDDAAKAVQDETILTLDDDYFTPPSPPAPSVQTQPNKHIRK